ncbi:normocyte-binding protein [Clostridium gasigenes]|uniref:normocyte-binding protein n=1 Tax=Clostridium gasigenes TaxID=94869 RepID=UPI001C0CAB5A|nr:normocyte-binding protein [Clostridium gasigenes]MBU3087130.1 normocyte-binding protein [Clostridium gasigenes]
MNLREKNFKEIYRAWKAGLGPFEPFMRSGPFVSLQTYSDFKLNYLLDEPTLYNLYKEKLAQITKNDFEKTFIIIDTNMSESLEIAYLLNNKFNIKPIINFNFLFHPYGLIGNTDSIERLILFGENLHNIKPTGYVLLLDYERYMDFPKDLYKKKLNNQYEFSAEDLPYAKTLKELGYNNLTIYTKYTLKEDIRAYIDTLNKDLTVEIINWG